MNAGKMNMQIIFAAQVRIKNLSDRVYSLYRKIIAIVCL